MSAADKGDFGPCHVNVGGRRRRSERGNMIQLGLNSGQLTPRGVATTDILTTNRHPEP